MPTYVLLRALNDSANVRVRAVSKLAVPSGQAAAANAAGAGSLASGTYYYKVTAVGDYGETTASGEVSAVVDGANNEVQRVTVSATSGTFTLTFNGQTTGTIAFDATNTTVKNALVALSNIDTADVAVSGSAGGPWDVTFQGVYANSNVAQMTASAAGLSGGASTAVVTTVTAGDDGDVVDVTWTAVTGAVSYKVYRGTSTGAEDHYFTVTTNSFTDTGGAGTAGTIPTRNTGAASTGQAHLKSDSDTLVNVDDLWARRDLSQHGAIGQYIVSGVNNRLADGTVLTVNS